MFGREKNKEKKQSSILGLMFNPRFGDDIKPIGAVITMFVRLVAYIFAINGMFPKNHPALIGNPSPDNPSTHLTLAQVIRTAYGALAFTREELPKIMLFAAVVGTLLFSALFIILALLSLLIGSARAQSMFVPPDEANDWGLSWINYIFLGRSIADKDISLGISNMCEWQSALGTALGYYSAGVLVVAGVVLLYHLTRMVAETAHTGKVMGNANQIWAPIRLVVAIGLLVPIGTSMAGGGACASGSGSVVAGLNTGQYIAIQMARWGSGLASQVWAKFVDKISFGSSLGAADCSSSDAQSPSCVHVPAEQARAFALGMIRNFACAHIYNEYNNVQMNPNSPIYVRYNSSTNFIGNEETAAHQSLCGGFRFLDEKQIADSPYKPVFDAQKQVVTGTAGLMAFEAVAKNHYLQFVNPSPDMESNAKALAAAENFRIALDSAAQNAMNSVENSLKDSFKKESFVKGGWLAAGTFFNTIARLQSLRADSIENALPSLVPPSIYEEQGRQGTINWDAAGIGGVPIDSGVGVYRDDSPIKRTYYALTRKTPYPGVDAWLGISGANNADLAKEVMAGLPPPGSGSSWFVNSVLGILDAFAIETGVWNDKGQLGIKFGQNRNPLQEIAAYGQNILSLSFKMVAGAALASGVSAVGSIPGIGAVLGPVFSVIGTLGATIFGSLALVFFMVGVLLGYFLPLVPFVRFFFASMTWIIGVAETVVAAPLLALAHLSPEGDGLPGNIARQGYLFILNMFLRPTLMIFGLIIGYLLFIVGIAFLNGMFLLAAKGTGAYTNLPVVAKLVFTVMYASLAYVLGQNAFKSIGMFPEYALRWLGSSGHIEKIGEHTTAMQAMTGVGTYLVGKGLLEAAQAPGKIAGGSMQKVAEGKSNALQSAQQQAMRDEIGRLRSAIGVGEDGNPIPGTLAASHIPQIDTSANPNYERQIDPQLTGDHRLDDEPAALVTYRAHEQAQMELNHINAREGRSATPEERADILRQVVGQYNSYMGREGVDQRRVMRDVMNRLT